jgi:uncharacterized protein (TIGR02186 family)
MRGIFAVLVFLAAPAMAAESIVTGLSQNKVQITTDFDGSDILVYGAVKRDAPAPSGEMHVIITLEGPSSPLVVRRKQKVMGIWLNGASVQIANAPSFYAVTATGPVDDILSQADDLRFGITLARRINTKEINVNTMDFPEYTEALRRIRLQSNQYQVATDSVQLVDQTLFRTDFALPANVTEGNYKVRLFILRAGLVVDSQERFINVRKTGLERDLTNMAHQQPLIYGLLSLVMAAVAGWAASAGFRFLRR